MKNVTISMDDELAQRARVAAARAGISVSKYMADAAKAKIEADEKLAGQSGGNRQIEALERIFSGPKWDVTDDGRMPTAEDRNARR
ncbi:hypothetical protein ACTDI4_17620 [Mesorhizobium sp. PUT5]|uniref:hypothetical protein n=1 Tax=Mesorhizobium sp. PUT5 TaxID=3454629 RepID=UPI003FA45699